ncbi:MAG: DUF6576 domain-containing protein, partial [Phycisphaerales bacterium JB059]
TLLLGVALFGGIVCFLERRRLQFLGTGALGATLEPDDDAREARARAKERARRDSEQEEVDRILAKISREGMGSLSTREKRTLKRATHHRRET